MPSPALPLQRLQLSLPLPLLALVLAATTPRIGSLSLDRAESRQRQLREVMPSGPEGDPRQPPYIWHDYDNSNFIIDQSPWPASKSSYPWSDAELEDMKPMGNFTRLIPLMQKLEAGGSARILVLGGSMTLGVGCHGQPWPRRLEKWLRKRYPTSNIELINQARGGTPTSSIAAGLGLIVQALTQAGSIDLVMLDTLVNREERYVDKERIINPGPAMLISYEKLIRSLHELLPRTPVFALMTSPNFDEIWHSQQSVASYYGVPRLDYAELVLKTGIQFDKRGAPTSSAFKGHNGPQIWSPVIGHPDWRAHQFIADLFANMWGKVWHATEVGDVRKLALASSSDPGFPAAPLNPQADLDLFSTCLKPLSQFSSFAPPNATGAPLVAAGNWSLFEDRPGKPGWIADTNGSTIRFPLRFGNKPRLTVSFLKGYEGLGEVLVSLNNHTGTLSGLHKFKTTQTFSMWFEAGGKAGGKAGVGKYLEQGHAGFDVPPGASMDLEVTVLHGKFKIMEVLSC